MPAFVFQPLCAADLPLIDAWLHRPHVRAAFGDPHEWGTEIAANLNADWVRHFRADWDRRPAGFVQYYDTTRAPSGAWSTEPPGSVGIDFFLGESELLGRGLGTRLLCEFADFVLETTAARRLVVDPDEGNLRSIGAARAAGFVHDPASGLWVLVPFAGRRPSEFSA